MERRHQTPTKRYLLLSTLALFATTALAQSSTTAAAGTPTSGGDSLPALTSAKPTSTPAAQTTTSASASLPGLSTSATGTGDLPKLPSNSKTVVPTYPAPSVPPTSNAPYMQTSKLPQGTVFIAVGAILGTFGAAVLVWRAVVACLLHRSVKRANLALSSSNDKFAVPGAPLAPFSKFTDHESQLSLGASNAVAGRGVRRTQRGPVPSATPSQSNLFFSPTAGNNANHPGNRSSTFLPSGFYAAGQGAPPQEHGPSISLTNLRPESRGLRPTSSHSPPPESPNLTPRRNAMRLRDPQMSTSSINLNQMPGSRAPSTYLEDLLDENPQQFPPQGVQQSWNQSRDRL